MKKYGTFHVAVYCSHIQTKRFGDKAVESVKKLRQLFLLQTFFKKAFAFIPSKRFLYLSEQSKLVFYCCSDVI